jgi:hypothetical protein
MAILTTQDLQNSSLLLLHISACSHTTAELTPSGSASFLAEDASQLCSELLSPVKCPVQIYTAWVTVTMCFHSLSILQI